MFLANKYEYKNKIFIFDIELKIWRKLPEGLLVFTSGVP